MTEHPVADPIHQFLADLERARATEPFDATAAALATADVEGAPSVRFVLVKVVDARGFVFFTNGHSRKGRELRGNPNAALAFHWHTLGEQVRVEGVVGAISGEESDRYFATRPRESQLGAWASAQSETILDRNALDHRLAEAEHRFGVQPVPRPPHWGGFRIVPTRVEFWHDRRGRLHDRWLYTRRENAWHCERLQP